MVKECCPAILFLMETKTYRNRNEKIQYKLGFENMFVVDRVGCRGGLALMWKKGVDVSIQNYSRHHINARIIDLVLVVYGRWLDSRVILRLVKDKKVGICWNIWNLVHQNLGYVLVISTKYCVKLRNVGQHGDMLNKWKISTKHWTFVSWAVRTIRDQSILGVIIKGMAISLKKGWIEYWWINVRLSSILLWK